MKIAVRYFSRGGNTKKVADAIAGALGVEAETIDAPVAEGTDLLFLGGSVYAGGVDTALRGFIDTLSAGAVSRAAVFSTAAVKISAYPQLRKLLEAKGIQVLDSNFHCRGQFAAFHRGRPNAEDLAKAARFAEDVFRKEQRQ